MSERLHTEKEAADREVKLVLDSLLRNLTDVRAQRVRSTSADARQRGEIWGLDTAILAIKRRLR